MDQHDSRASYSTVPVFPLFVLVPSDQRDPDHFPVLLDVRTSSAITELPPSRSVVSRPPIAAVFVAVETHLGDLAHFTVLLDSRTFVFHRVTSNRTKPVAATLIKSANCSPSKGSVSPRYCAIPHGNRRDLVPRSDLPRFPPADGRSGKRRRERPKGVVPPFRMASGRGPITERSDHV